MADKLRDGSFKGTNAERIPAKRYYDDAFFEFVKEKLWPSLLGLSKV